MDTRFDGALGNAQHCRCLDNGEAPEVVEGQEHAIVVLEAIEGSGQRPSGDDAIEVIGGECERWVQLDDPTAPAGAADTGGRTDDLATKPRRERIWFAQVVQALPRGKERVLYGIRTVRGRAGQDRRRTDGGPKMWFDESAEGIAIPAPRSDHEGRGGSGVRAGR
jgi:hypothetical protein